MKAILVVAVDHQIIMESAQIMITNCLMEQIHIIVKMELGSFQEKPLHNRVIEVLPKDGVVLLRHQDHAQAEHHKLIIVQQVVNGMEITRELVDQLIIIVVMVMN